MIIPVAPSRARGIPPPRFRLKGEPGPFGLSIKSGDVCLFLDKRIRQTKTLSSALLFPCGLRLTSTIFTAALGSALHYTLNHLKDLKHQKLPLQLIQPDCGDQGKRGRENSAAPHP